MRFNLGPALGAAAILGLGAAAQGEDVKTADKEAQKAEAPKTETGKAEASGSASTSKHRQGKKMAGKRQQLPRGAGPVGVEGTESGQPSQMKPELSTDTGLQPTTEQQKGGQGAAAPPGGGPSGCRR